MYSPCAKGAVTAMSEHAGFHLQAQTQAHAGEEAGGVKRRQTEEMLNFHILPSNLKTCTY